MNIWKIIYLNCGEIYEFVIDRRSYTHNLSNCEIKAWKKKFRPERDSNPWPLALILVMRCVRRSWRRWELEESTGCGQRFKSDKSRLVSDFVRRVATPRPRIFLQVSGIFSACFNHWITSREKTQLVTFSRPLACKCSQNISADDVHITYFHLRQSPTTADLPAKLHVRFYFDIIWSNAALASFLLYHGLYPKAWFWYPADLPAT